jgi:hypothetical protein
MTDDFSEFIYFPAQEIAKTAVFDLARIQYSSFPGVEPRSTQVGKTVTNIGEARLPLTKYKLTCNKLEVAIFNCTTAGESLAGKARCRQQKKG